MGKKTYHIVVHIAIVMLLQASFAIGADVPIEQRNIFVVFREVRQADSANALLPAGYRVHEALVSKDRSTFFATNTPLPRTRTAPSRRLKKLLRAEAVLTRTFRVEIPENTTPAKAVMEMVALSNIVEHAEQWSVATVNAVPNDPQFGEQKNLQRVKAAEAWNVFEGDSTIVIGISDNGILQSHEDLRNNIAPNNGEIPDNGVDDDNNGYIDDYLGLNMTSAIDGMPPGETTNPSGDGHGTKVTGLAVARTNNGLGIASTGNKTRFFPMKTAARGTTSILFGYQSLVYAADRGLDVVNTSWGVVKPFSMVDQSVIDYCVGKNTLVVASGGNHGAGTLGNGWRERNYPAAYNGVLGVAEATPTDQIIASSGLGGNCKVVAPSYDAITTDASGGYTSFGTSGTSFASPMVAGLAGLVRARHRSLDAEQVSALIRRTADPINNVSSEYLGMVPGMMNMLKALQTPPASVCALRIAETTVLRTDGMPASSMAAGDTVIVSFTIVNDLGKGKDILATLRLADGNGWSATVLQSTAVIDSINTLEERTVGPFTVVLNSVSTYGPAIWALDVAGDDASGSYAESLLWYLDAPAGMASFTSTELVYSVGDKGALGYSSGLTNRAGAGFGWVRGYQLMAPSGFILAENSTRSLTGYIQDETVISDFSAELPFGVNPQPNECLLTDARSASPIGVNVGLNCGFVEAQPRVALIRVVVTNTGSQPLTDVSSGYYMDWDVGTGGGANIARVTDDPIPAALRGNHTGAFTIRRNGIPAAVCCAVVSANVANEAQVVTMTLSEIVDDADGFTSADRIRVLTSGKAISSSGPADMCAVAGMRYKETLDANASYAYDVFIGVGESEDEAIAEVRRALERTSDVQNNEAVQQIVVYPNPADNQARIILPEASRSVVVTDMAGRVVYHTNVEGTTQHVFDTSVLASGFYMLRVNTAGGVTARSMQVVR